MMQAKIQAFLYTPARTFVKYPASDQSIYARYARAVAAFRAPEMTTAVRETQKLIAEQPDNPFFYELLGQIYYENGKAEASIEPNRRAVALAPNESLLLIGLARSLLATERAELRIEAEAALRTALRLEPSNAFAWNQLAVVADRNGQVGLARLATAEEAYNLGDMLRAHRFSDLAMRNLVRATPEWRRAFDISTITLPIVTKAGRRGNDRRPLTLMPERPIASTNSAPAPREGLLRVVDIEADPHGHVHAETHAKH